MISREIFSLMEVLASNGVVVSLSRVEIGRSKAHIQMIYHFANPRKEVEEVYLLPKGRRGK